MLLHILVAILCALFFAWIVWTFIRVFDKSGARMGEQFVEDAKKNPNNPLHGTESDSRFDDQEL